MNYKQLGDNLAKIENRRQERLDHDRQIARDLIDGREWTTNSRTRDYVLGRILELLLEQR